MREYSETVLDSLLLFVSPETLTDKNRLGQGMFIRPLQPL